MLHGKPVQNAPTPKMATQFIICTNGRQPDYISLHCALVIIFLFNCELNSLQSFFLCVDQVFVLHEFVNKQSGNLALLEFLAHSEPNNDRTNRQVYMNFQNICRKETFKRPIHDNSYKHMKEIEHTLRVYPWKRRKRCSQCKATNGASPINFCGNIGFGDATLFSTDISCFVFTFLARDMTLICFTRKLLHYSPSISPSKPLSKNLPANHYLKKAPSKPRMINCWSGDSYL